MKYRMIIGLSSQFRQIGASGRAVFLQLWKIVVSSHVLSLQLYCVVDVSRNDSQLLVNGFLVGFVNLGDGEDSKDC